MMLIKKYAKFVLAIALIIFLGIFLAKVDFNEVIRHIENAGWYFLAIICSTTLAYIFATKAWQLCLFPREVSSYSIYKLFVIRQIGEALTLINPTNIVGGELSKIYMLRKDGLDSSKTEMSIVASRGLIIASYFLLALLIVVYFIFIQTDASLQEAIIGIAVVLTVVTFLFLNSLFHKKLLLFNYVKSALSIFPSWKWKLKSLIRLKRINILLADLYVNHKKILITAFAYSFIHWLLGSLEFYFILNAFELNVNFLDAILMEVGVMVFKSLGGFIPGQIGIEEYGNKVMLGILQIDGLEIWAAVSILRRARQLFWIAVSMILFSIYYRKLKWKFSS